MATFLTYKADMDEDTFYDDAAAEIKLLATSVLFVVFTYLRGFSLEAGVF